MHRRRQRRRHRLRPWRIAGENAVDRLPPPGQPHVAKKRFPDPLADAGDLKIESIEGEQPLTHCRRRKQGGNEPVVVEPSHVQGAVGKRLFRHCLVLPVTFPI